MRITECKFDSLQREAELKKSGFEKKLSFVCHDHNYLLVIGFCYDKNRYGCFIRTGIGIFTLFSGICGNVDFFDCL